MSRFPLYICLSSALIVGCKSRYGFTDVKPEGAVIQSNDATSTPSVPGQGTIPSNSTQTTPSTTPNSSTNGPSASIPPSNTQPNGSSDPSSVPNEAPNDGVPVAPGGPVAGIEVWQDGSQVTTVTTGKLIYFKPTSWTRDTSASSGCDINRGIVQASWTIGSRAAADIQRFAGQECRLFDYAGTFTKPGNVTVQMDVISVDGEQAHAETVLTVVGGSPTSTSTTQK